MSCRSTTPSLFGLLDATAPPAATRAADLLNDASQQQGVIVDENGSQRELRFGSFRQDQSLLEILEEVLELVDDDDEDEDFMDFSSVTSSQARQRALQARRFLGSQGQGGGGPDSANANNSNSSNRKQ